MRCVDVIRELSVPTGEPEPAALAEHLAGCPGCASRAEQSARLDRLWEATRPSEPSAAAWDRIWANVSATLDHQAVPVGSASASASHFPSPARRPWRRSVVAALAIAQAAVILVAATLAWRDPARPPQAPAGPAVAIVPVPDPAPVAISSFEIEPNQITLINLDRREARWLDQAAVDGRNAVDGFFIMHNAVESMAADSIAATMSSSQWPPT